MMPAGKSCTDHVSLLVQPGQRHTLTGDPIPVGVPYGSRARLICLYLQSEALKNNSREIELGRSLYAWRRRLDIPIGSELSMAAVRDCWRRRRSAYRRRSVAATDRLKALSAPILGVRGERAWVGHPEFGHQG